MEKRKISLKQFMLMLFIFSIGDSVLVLPATVVSVAKQDGWVSGLVSLFVGTITLYLLYKVGKLDRNRTLIEICQKALGKWFGKAIGAIFILYFLLSVGLLLREMSDFMLVNYLEETPVEVVMVLFLVAVVMGVRLGIEIIGRTVEVFFPWIFVMMFLCILFLLSKIKITLMYPILENGFGQVIEGVIPFVSFPFLEVIPFLMFFPYVREKNIKFRHVLLPVLCGNVILLIATLYSILILGVEATSTSMYPTLKLAQKINIGNFLQRLDVLVAVLFLFVIYFKTSFYFYATTHGFAQWINVKEYRYMINPIAFIAVPLALLITPDVIHLNEHLASIWPFFDFTVAVVFPLLILLGWKLKRKKKVQLAA